LNHPVTLRKIARSVLPANVRSAIHKVLGNEAPISVRFETVASWPEATWRQANLSQSLIEEIAAFNLKRARNFPGPIFAEPIVQDNLKLLSEISLNNATLLDFGCGNGIYYDILRSHPRTRSWKYCGADANPAFIEFCKLTHPDIRFEELPSNQKLPFNDGEFDVVFASGVIQCIEHYGSTLEQLFRISKKYVVISRLPMGEKKAKILLQHFKHRKDTFEQHLPLHVMNRMEFENCLNEIGFRVLQHERGSEFLIMPDTSELVHYYGYLVAKEGA
jgi:putative methyltransferase (TIGR04325 family)